MIVANAVIASKNGKLITGSKEDNIKNLQDDKSINKQIQLFDKYDSDNNGVISQDEIQAYDKSCKRKNGLIIAGVVVGVLAIGAGIYLAKTGKISKWIDNIAQKNMSDNLAKSYGDGVNIQKGANGSLFIPSDAPPVPEWKADGVSDFDKFIKRYGLSAVDESGAEIGK